LLTVQIYQNFWTTDEAADLVDFIKEIHPRQPEVIILWLMVQASIRPALSRLLPKAQLSCGGRVSSGNT